MSTFLIYMKNTTANNKTIFDQTLLCRDQASNANTTFFFPRMRSHICRFVKEAVVISYFPVPSFSLLMTHWCGFSLITHHVQRKRKMSANALSHECLKNLYNQINITNETNIENQAGCRLACACVFCL
ncbi:hypothetical protein Pelo_2880 [Pelomyxa schiedti]|nr:hypothetical protein Pelo_2880 [Pelomyxa schiedti]